MQSSDQGHESSPGRRRAKPAWSDNAMCQRNADLAGSPFQIPPFPCRGRGRQRRFERGVGITSWPGRAASGCLPRGGLSRLSPLVSGRGADWGGLGRGAPQASLWTDLLGSTAGKPGGPPPAVRAPSECSRAEHGLRCRGGQLGGQRTPSRAQQSGSMAPSDWRRLRGGQHRPGGGPPRSPTRALPRRPCWA